MNKKSLAEVALLTESEAAKMFKMGTTRFKARYVARDSKRSTERRTERHDRQFSKVQNAKKCKHDSFTSPESRLKHIRETMLTVHLLFAFADAESWAFPGGRIES